MINILFIACGGAVGAVLRYLLSNWVTSATSSSFPWATLLVNIAGCLAIGFLVPILTSDGRFSDEYRLFLIVGILGGFTTFSSFGWEAFSLVKKGELVAGLSYMLLSNIAGLLAVVLGFRLSGR